MLSAKAGSVRGHRLEFKYASVPVGLLRLDEWAGKGSDRKARSTGHPGGAWWDRHAGMLETGFDKQAHRS